MQEMKQIRCKELRTFENVRLHIVCNKSTTRVGMKFIQISITLFMLKAISFIWEQIKRLTNSFFLYFKIEKHARNSKLKKMVLHGNGRRKRIGKSKGDFFAQGILSR